MYKKALDFIKYNNAFTIGIMVLFLGAGISFAASPDLRDSVYSSTETVVSVDNSWIVSADLDNFDFNLTINSITEDEKNYYAVYSYQTLAVEDSIWQNQETEKTLTVSKEALDGKDLGLYVAKELGENINYELSYLKRVQKLEIEKGKSQKVIATEYAGLIGKLLDPKEEVIEGYSPVIPEVVPTVPATVELNLAEVVVSTPAAPTESEAAPAPGEMIDENLVHEVVEGLLQNQATSTLSTPTPEVTPTPTPLPSDSPTPTDTPTPIPTSDATSSPLVDSPSATPTPSDDGSPTSIAPTPTAEPTQ